MTPWLDLRPLGIRCQTRIMSDNDTCRINGTYGSAIIRRFLLEGLLVQGFEGTEMTQEHLGWISSKIPSAVSGILLLLIENVRT